MTRNPDLNALILKERLSSDYRAALLGNRQDAPAILARLRAVVAMCLGVRG